MTDRVAHRPRTATVALLAPAAAAVLAGSVAWAAGDPPSPPPAPSSTVTPAAVPPGGRAGQARDIERLREELTSLRAELRGLPAGAGGFKPAAKPPRAARTAPPPVHATTGAS